MEGYKWLVHSTLDVKLFKYNTYGSFMCKVPKPGIYQVAVIGIYLPKQDGPCCNVVNICIKGWREPYIHIIYCFHVLRLYS